MLGQKKNKAEKTYTIEVTEGEATIIGRLSAACAESALTDSQFRQHSKKDREAMADVFLDCSTLLTKIHAAVKPDEPRPNSDAYTTIAAAMRSGWAEDDVKKATEAFDSQDAAFMKKIREAEQDPEFQRKLRQKERQLRGQVEQGGSWGL